jgi:soluble lytic murein transglycosylase-like protein
LPSSKALSGNAFMSMQTGRRPLAASLRFAVGALLLCASAPAAAEAQIYAWRDSAGNLVLSDKAKAPQARSYAVTPAGGLRTTRPLSRKAAKYEGLIQEHAAAQGVSPDLVRAVIQAESAFNPFARSVKGAMGLMQLMPATARELGVVDPYDPAENIRAGVAYLKHLLVKYAQNVELALAAYNAGPGAVEKHGTKIPPYRETRNYVAKVRTNAAAAGTTGTPAPRTRIYRTVVLIDGKEVVRYTDQRKPGKEIVKSAERR